jgi:hypothetical protein
MAWRSGLIADPRGVQTSKISAMTGAMKSSSQLLPWIKNTAEDSEGAVEQSPMRVTQSPMRGETASAKIGQKWSNPVSLACVVSNCSASHDSVHTLCSDCGNRGAPGC